MGVFNLLKVGGANTGTKENENLFVMSVSFLFASMFAFSNIDSIIGLAFFAAQYIYSNGSRMRVSNVEMF